MTETSLDELGPAELPVGATNLREMVTELVALVDAGTIRLINVMILTKDGDGLVDAIELLDVPELEELEQLEGINVEFAELLAADEVESLAATMAPGSTAGVLIWDNL